MYRVAYNPALPVVAAQPFTAAGRSFVSKQPVDWRALGITEMVLLQWWQAGLVTFVGAVTPPAGGELLPTVTKAPPAPAAVDLQMPGIASSSTASNLTRAERRALRRQQG